MLWLCAGLREVFAPKLSGLRNLASFLSGAPLVRSAAFSSIAGVLGSPGQANYAAANAAMDSWVTASQSQVSSLLTLIYTKSHKSATLIGLSVHLMEPKESGILLHC